MPSAATDERTYYNLVATLGASPAVVTETIWSLAVENDPPMHPAAVHLVTTATGKRIWEQRMEGEEQPWQVEAGGAHRRGQVWQTFCEEILQGPPPEVEVHVPTHDDTGKLLRDVQNERDDLLCANYLWSLVYRLAQPGTPPLVASLAGGRKTMSAHLHSTMEYLARPQDQLLHLLVRPGLERADPAFFYPPLHSADPGLSRISISFQPLRRHHERGLFQQVDDPSDRQAVMDVAQKHDYEPPARLRLWAGAPPEQPVQAEFLDEEGSVIDACQLTPRHLATLLVLAEHIGRGKEATVRKATLRKAQAEQQRQFVYWCCFIDEPGKAWIRKKEDTAEGENWRQKANDRISRAVGGLKKRVADLPIARDHLTLESSGQDRYRWAAEPLPLEVVLAPAKHRKFESRNISPDGERLFEYLSFVPPPAKGA